MASKLSVRTEISPIIIGRQDDTPENRDQKTQDEDAGQEDFQITESQEAQLYEGRDSLERDTKLDPEVSSRGYEEKTGR